MARYDRSTEIRQVTRFDITSLVDILESDWRSLFYLIPRQIAHIDRPAGSYAAKYNGTQERELEKYAGPTNECARQLLDEWGCSGKRDERPTLDHLLRLLVKGGMFRAADELAIKLLKEDPPSRPVTGPAAPIDITGALNRELERGLELVSEPNTEQLAGLRSTTLDLNLDRATGDKREDVRGFPNVLRDSMMDGSLPVLSRSDNEQYSGGNVELPNISALLRPAEDEGAAGGTNSRTASYSSERYSDESSSESNASSHRTVSEAPSTLRTINEDEEEDEEDESGGLPNLSIFGSAQGEQEPVAGPSGLNNPRPISSFVRNSSSYRSDDSYSDDSSSGSTVSGNQSFAELPATLRTISEEREPVNLDQGMPNLSIFGASQEQGESSSNGLPNLSSLMNAASISSARVETSDPSPPPVAQTNPDLIQFSMDVPALVNYPYARLESATSSFDNHEFQNANPNHPDGRLLGRGGFGAVYMGLNLTPTAPIVAIKRLFKSEDDSDYKYRQKFDRERDILSKYSHPNIVKLLGYSDNAGLCLIYEYMPDGNLDQALNTSRHNAQKPLAAATRLNYLLGIISAIDYLHNAPDPLIHRDVTPANILLHGPVAKLADFGLVKRVVSTKTTVVAGTAPYLPQEAFWGTVTTALDVYSFGVVMAQVVTGEDAEGRLMERISEGGDYGAMADRNVRPEEVDRWVVAGGRLLELSSECLRERVKRPLARALREHIEDVHRRAHGGLNGCV